MKFKRLLSQMALALLCTGLFTTQMLAMEMPQVQQVVGRCSGRCNEIRNDVLTMSCGHQICSSCDKINSDDYDNLSISSKCPCCQDIYKQGNEIIGPQGAIINKALFNPALTPLSLKEVFFSTGVGLGISFITNKFLGKDWTGNTNRNTAYMVSGFALIPVIAGYFKFKKINLTSQNAHNLAQSMPHLSTIIEKRTKAFRTQYGLYTLALASLPFSLAAMPSLAQAGYLRSAVACGLFSLLAAPGMAMLDYWGSRYQSIPKLK